MDGRKSLGSMTGSHKQGSVITFDRRIPLKRIATSASELSTRQSGDQGESATAATEDGDDRPAEVGH